MSALHYVVRREAAFQEALERAGGDLERLARGLMSACTALAAENERLMKTPRTRGRGAPKSIRNPLPLSTKEHGQRGYLRLLKPYRKHGMTAREAALFELINAGISASNIGFGEFDRLQENLAKRISEAERDSK